MIKHFKIYLPEGARSYKHLVTNTWLTEPGRNGKTMLDAGVGGGETSKLLRDLGFKVTATSYSKERPEHLTDDIMFVGNVDLNKKLPFPDQSFDYAHLEEVIEHVENPAQTIREFNRILKPGGAWVVATPNIHSLSSRVRFLLTGFVKGRKRMVNYVCKPVPGDNIYLVNIWQLHYLLYHYKFKIEHVTPGPIILLNILFYPFLLPLMKLTAPRAFRLTREQDLLRGTQGVTREEAILVQNQARKELKSLMTSSKLALGENLILKVRKTGEIPKTAEYMTIS